MLHFSQYVIVREMAGILDMVALGAADGPVDAALNLRSALKPLTPAAARASPKTGWTRAQRSMACSAENYQ